MEEVGDDFPDCLLVVDECFENFRLAICWDDVVIGDGGRHKTRVALGNGYFIARTSYLYLAVTIENHHYYEGVVLYHVAMERLCGLDYLDGEVWGVEDLVGRAYVLCMFRAVFGINFIVDGL